MEDQLELARPNIQEAGRAPPVQVPVRCSARERHPPLRFKYSIIVTLISLLLRPSCVKNTKYILYLCILYSISSNECISKEGRYVASARR